MMKLVELEDGKYRLTVTIDEPPIQYKEEFCFVRVEDEGSPEKEGGFRLELV